MIKIVTGVPGSGKTYYAINHLLDKHYKKIDGEWHKKSDVTILTNIKDFKLEHINLDDAMRKAGVRAEVFFTVPYQEKVIKKYGYCIYVLDEAQRLFHRKFYNKDVFYFFDYHRHLGIDIYLVTQDIKKLPLEIKSVAESEIRAVRKSLSFFGEFKYSARIDDDILERIVLKPDKTIFALYTSFESETKEKQKNRVKWVTMGAFALMPIGVVIFLSVFGGSKKDVNAQEKKIEPVKVVYNQNVGIKEKEKEMEWIPMKNWVGTKNDGYLVIVAYEIDNRIHKMGDHQIKIKQGSPYILMAKKDESYQEKNEKTPPLNAKKTEALPRAEVGEKAPGQEKKENCQGEKKTEEKIQNEKNRKFKRMQKKGGA